MKLKELKKLYQFDEKSGKFILDVQLEDYRDAYSEWDFSPFVNRDLDEDLMEYLLQCSFEIPLKNRVVIKFYILNQKVNESRENRSMTGIYNFFHYQIRKLNFQRNEVLKQMLSFFILGSGLLMVGAYFGDHIEKSLITGVLIEGLFIGGWVMLWEMFSAWIFDIKHIRHKKKHFQRLLEAEIQYRYPTK